MNKSLAKLMGQPENTVAKAVTKLEDKNGYPSHDVRHLAENIQKTRLKLIELGLDPDDTTGEELYHVLLGKFSHDSQRFDQQFSLVGSSDNAPASLATRIVLNNFQMPERWVLKSSAAKKLIKNQPPKNLMRRLKYRSADSLLKRQKLSEIYLAIDYTESASWLKSHAKLVSSLDSTAFEIRPISLSTISTDKWDAIESDELLAYSDNYGVLALMLPHQDISTLSLVIALLDGLASFGDLRVSEHASKVSQELVWWSDMDGLVANLGSECVSMNLKDVFLNSLHAHSYSDRLLENGQHSFWRDLLSRYENQLIPEQDLNVSFRNLLNLKAPTNQPAFEFEYSEDM
jgi:hypothetical protein